jgi:hypothetical protein
MGMELLSRPGLATGLATGLRLSLDRTRGRLSADGDQSGDKPVANCGISATALSCGSGYFTCGTTWPRPSPRRANWSPRLQQARSSQPGLTQRR